MSWLWRMMLVVMVALVPGAFALLLTYVATRTLRARWQLARVRARSEGTPVSIRSVLATLEFKELVREARAAL